MGAKQDRQAAKEAVEFVGMVGTVIATKTVDVANDNYAEDIRLAA